MAAGKAGEDQTGSCGCTPAISKILSTNCMFVSKDYYYCGALHGGSIGCGVVCAICFFASVSFASACVCVECMSCHFRQQPAADATLLLPCAEIYVSLLVPFANQSVLCSPEPAQVKGRDGMGGEHIRGECPLQSTWACLWSQSIHAALHHGARFERPKIITLGATTFRHPSAHGFTNASTKTRVLLSIGKQGEDARLQHHPTAANFRRDHAPN